MFNVRLTMPKGVQEKRTEVLENKVDRIATSPHHCAANYAINCKNPTDLTRCDHMSITK